VLSFEEKCRKIKTERVAKQKVLKEIEELPGDY
jgi:hypothetical protein